MARPLALVIALAAAAPARAAHPLATDDTGTPAPGAMEVEVSSAAVETSPGGKPRIDLAVVNHVGVLRALDLGVALQLGLVGPAVAAGSLGDPVLDLKWRWFDQDGVAPALALRLDVRPPLGLPASDTGFDLGLVLVASWRLPHGLAASVNVGVHGQGLGEHDAMVPALASAALAWSMRESLELAAELVAEGHPGHLHAVSGLAGVVWHLTPTLALSAGGGGVVTGGPTAGLLVTLGVTAALEGG